MPAFRRHGWQLTIQPRAAQLSLAGTRQRDIPVIDEPGFTSPVLPAAGVFRWPCGCS
jgi:hypothetical protein